MDITTYDDDFDVCICHRCYNSLFPFCTLTINPKFTFSDQRLRSFIIYWYNCIQLLNPVYLLSEYLYCRIVNFKYPGLATGLYRNVLTVFVCSMYESCLYWMDVRMTVIGYVWTNESEWFLLLTIILTVQYLITYILDVDLKSYQYKDVTYVTFCHIATLIIYLRPQLTWVVSLFYIYLFIQ